MATIRAVLNRVKTLDPILEAKRSLIDTKDVLLDLNVEQLHKGQKSDGRFMPDYSPVSVEVYGKPPGPIKLYDTGAFYRGFMLDINGSILTITSSDDKTDMLFKRYATKKHNIFGLNPLFAREYLPVLQKRFFFRVRNKTGL